MAQKTGGRLSCYASDPDPTIRKSTDWVQDGYNAGTFNALGLCATCRQLSIDCLLHTACTQNAECKQAWSERLDPWSRLPILLCISKRTEYTTGTWWVQKRLTDVDRPVMTGGRFFRAIKRLRAQSKDAELSTVACVARDERKATVGNSGHAWVLTPATPSR